MREILFRAKRSKRYCPDRDWTYGVPFIDHEGDCIFKTSASEFVVDPETVGQYTGLTDKNGKKIFEGDIVHCVSQRDMANMVVIFEQGEFRMVLVEKYKDYIEGCGFYAIRCFTKEVIGNIHDNPELLKGE